MNELPKTLEEALAMGYQVIGRETKVSPDESTETGVANLQRGNETLDVPYSATFTYGTPHSNEEESC